MADVVGVGDAEEEECETTAELEEGEDPVLRLTEFWRLPKASASSTRPAETKEMPNTANITSVMRRCMLKWIEFWFGKE